MEEEKVKAVCKCAVVKSSIFCTRDNSCPECSSLLLPEKYE